MRRDEPRRLQSPSELQSNPRWKQAVKSIDARTSPSLPWRPKPSLRFPFPSPDPLGLQVAQTRQPQMLLEPGIDPPQGPTWRRRSERRRAARHHREWETQSLPRPGRLRLPSAIDSTTPLIQNQTRLQKKAERPRQTKTQLVFSSRNGRQSPSPLAFSLSRDSPRSLPSGSIRESELREGEVIAPPRPAPPRSCSTSPSISTPPAD